MIRDEVLTAEEVEGKSNTELLSKHILELQKDKGNLIDKVRELEQENEQIKNSDTLCKLIGEQKRKIIELEARNEKLCQSITDFQNREAGLESQIAELKAQIEKMKCCSNCDNWNWKHNKCEKKLKGDCFKHSKWVMRNF